MKKLTTFLLCGSLCMGLAHAAERVNFSTVIEARIDKQAWTAARKSTWRKAVKAGLGDGAGTVVGRDDPSVGLFMGILSHAEKRKVSPESAVAVAGAAFRAVRKGAEPKRLLRLATRVLDLRRKASRAQDWLLGLADLRQLKIDGEVAEALVSEAIEQNWPQAQFGSIKWCLVRAGRKGHDTKAFLAFLLKEGRSGKDSPDRVCAKATRFFARRSKKDKQTAVSAHSTRRSKKDKQTAVSAHSTRQSKKDKKIVGLADSTRRSKTDKKTPAVVSPRPPKLVSRLSAKDRLVRMQMAETVGKTRVAKPAMYKLALPLPGSLPGCESLVRFFDMDGDGQEEKYKVVSLLECNGQNLVSLVKSQVEGTCSFYSTTGYLETLVGRKLLAARPATYYHPLLDFLPVDLGEAFNHYCLVPIPILAGSSMSVPKGEKSTYATLEAFLPQTEHLPMYMLMRPLKELEPGIGGAEIKALFANSPWHKLAAKTAVHFKALSPQHCTSVAPDVDFSDPVQVARIKSLAKKYWGNADPMSPAEKDEFLGKIVGPYVNCIHDAARSKGMVFAVAPYELMREAIDMKRCLDAAGKKVDCQSEDAVDFDYGKVDAEIRTFLDMGYPVQTTMNWEHWKTAEHRDLDAGSDYFYYRLTCPGALSAFACDEDESDAASIDGGTYCVGYGHSVLIVGYLKRFDSNQKSQGQDYWIIKNSHGWSKDEKKAKIHLVATPSSTGPITEARSTKRLFYSDGRQSKYFVFKDVNFVRFGPEIQSLDDIAAGSDMAAAMSDVDGDGVIDFFDNCPFKPNASQLDGDKDWVGDACDACPSTYDRYQSQSNTNIHDPEADGLPFACDNCDYHVNPDQKDSNEDGKGDVCDDCPHLKPAQNKDKDCIAPADDNCPEAYNPGQENLDGDKLGDVCDPDKDGDGISNVKDNCPNEYNPSQLLVDSGLSGFASIHIPWACGDEWGAFLDFLLAEHPRKFKELQKLAKTIKKGPPPNSPVPGDSPYLRFLPRCNAKVLDSVLQSLKVSPRIRTEMLRVKSSLDGRRK